ncbi:hypothetical protein NGC82_13860 [Enterococcus casseliflavus]|uniref:hypothetical protein n=1 Tax=Enterococcus casseliflavus TaxID=37734 RepID=UPI001F0E8170|nr:hypothetical protein [Enterococcus casseliflavus]MEC5340399.1 hypothetical protein [Enterococcus casseliflavus]
MKNKSFIVIILSAIIATSWLSYTIMDQQKQIVKLEQQLQHEQLKYKMLYRDPVVRDAIESGG